MPTYYGNILVVSQKELTPAFYTQKSLWKKVSVDEKRGFGMKRIRRGGGNGENSKSLILFDSLPAHIKEALGDPRKEESCLIKVFEIDLAAQKFFHETHRFEDGSSLTDEFKELYTTHASVLNAVFKMKEMREQLCRDMGHKARNIWESLYCDVQVFAEPLQKKYGLTFRFPDNVRVFERVANRYKNEGYPSLISGRHKNQNRLKLDKNTVQLLENIFSEQAHKPTKLEVYMQYNSFLCGNVDIINNETGELYNPADFEPLSERAISGYLSKWKSKIGTLQKRRNDRQKNIGRFKPCHDMELPKYAGSLYSIDDRKPPFEYESGKRVWFYNGVDAASGAITAWVYGKTKEGVILDFYRQIARNYYEWGVPLPFELECEASLNSSYRDTFLKEGTVFQRINIEGNYARGKYIERINGILRYVYEKKYAGWIARPHALSENNQDDGANRVLPYDKIVDISLGVIEQYNNGACPRCRDKNNCEGCELKELNPDCTGVSRFDYFLNMQHKDLPATNWQAVVRHVGYREQTSCRTGRVALQGQSLVLGDKGKVCTGEALINLMRMAEGNDLTVYWLDDNAGNIMKAYAYIGDRYICELLTLTYQRASLERTPEDERKRELMSAYVATIEAYGRKRKNDIEKITVIDNRQDTVSDTFRISDRLPATPAHNSRIAANWNFDDDYKVEVLPDIPADETELEPLLNGVATEYQRPAFEEIF